jgi:hypothetical protein
MQGLKAAVFGVGLFLIGVIGLLAPDPTPEPVVPPDPAQQFLFVLMIAGGICVGIILVISAFRERRENQQLHRAEHERPDE